MSMLFCAFVLYVSAQSSVPPTLTAVSPTSVGVGAGPTTITLTGTGFLPSSVVRVNGAAVNTTYVSSSSMTAMIPASQLANSAVLQVSVLNGGTPSSVSNFIEFYVLSLIAP